MDDNTENQQIELLEGEPGRSFFNKLFGKLSAGSLRGSIFSLASTTIGPSALMQPIIFSHTGIVLGILLQLATGSVAYMGFIGISKSADKHKNYNYPKLVGKVLGENYGLFLNSVIIIYVFTSLIGYQIIFGGFISSVLESINVPGDPETNRIISMVLSTSCFTIPLALFRKLTSLRFVAVLSVLTLLYITIVTVVEFPCFTSEHDYSKVKYIELDLYVFPGYAFILYAFTCHTNLVQIQEELKNSNYRRIKKVSGRVTLILLVPYILIGVFGYLSVFDDAPLFFIMRKAPDSISNDWLMVVSRALISVCLIFVIPINLPPCRAALISVFFKIEGDPPLKV